MELGDDGVELLEEGVEVDGDEFDGVGGTD
jgi:hypothetical protein